MSSLANIAAVGFGGMAGSLLRYGVGIWLLRPASSFPMNTLLVNTAGSILIGLAIGFGARQSWPNHWLLLLTTGFCGGFTTFSAFSAEVILMMKAQQYVAALGYIFASLILGIGGAALGFAISKHV